MAEPLTPQQTDAIIDALYGGRKIEAIKLYREATGAGLAESKGFVEKLEAELRAQHPDKFKTPPGGKGCAVGAGVFLAIVALGAGVLLVFLK
ncbi:MAG: ribosomal protein L7/L12 [Verrucomicrobia bacterium]|nr:ribosomal protein L7/L12 [Verrucomicrobiota bacterium]